MWSFLKRPQPGTGAEDAPASHRTLALRAALDAIEHIEAPRILDFGSASGDNVSFFSQVGGRMEILDLYSRLSERRFDDDALREVVAGASASDEPFDLILAWDVLDYLSREQIRALFAMLAHRRAPGTRILLSLCYAKDMPMHPRGYRIESAEILAFEPVRAMRPSPRYQESTVLKAVPGLDVEASFLMRHGAREYVFRQVVATQDAQVDQPIQANG